MGNLLSCASNNTSGSSTEDGLTPAEIKEFRKQCLDEHNAKRVQHGAPKMKVSAALNDMAQTWARRMAQSGEFKHSPKEGRQYKGMEYIGENIASDFYSSTDPAAVNSHRVTGKQTVENWYEEHSNYNFDNPGFSQNTGHFTQVVWKASTELGIGVVRRQTERQVQYFVVANYAPGGNYGAPSEYKVNVMPLQK